MRYAPPMKRNTARPAARRALQRAQPPAVNGLQSLQAAFRILDALSNAHQSLGLTDLAAALGELKPRLYRHLSTMKRIGAVYQDARNGRYSLGGKLFSLGEAALEQFDLRFVAAPYLTQLRDQTRQTALLSVPNNGEPIVLSCVEYRDRLSISSRPGNRPPPHCSSQGRVALAFADEAARKRILARKLTAFTKHSIVDRGLIEDAPRRHTRAILRRGERGNPPGNHCRVRACIPRKRRTGGHHRHHRYVRRGRRAAVAALVATLHRVAGSLSAELNCRIYHERGLMK